MKNRKYKLKMKFFSKILLQIIIIYLICILDFYIIPSVLIKYSLNINYVLIFLDLLYLFVFSNFLTRLKMNMSRIIKLIDVFLFNIFLLLEFYYFNHCTFIIYINIILLLIFILIQYINYILQKPVIQNDNIDLNILNYDLSFYKNSSNYVITDAPIKCNDNDILNYDNFIISFSEFLRNCNPESSFRIGLSGAWGSGKTSVLHLVSNELSKDNIYFNFFSPWNYNSFDDILYYLCLNIGEFLFDNRIINEFVFNKFTSDIKKIISGFLSNKVGINFNDFFDDDNVIGNVLNDCLDRSSKKIIFVIDDVDRLSYDQIKQLMKFLYNFLDLKKVIFIICYDKKIIKNAYGDFYNFLNKIINCEIHMPVISSGMLSTVVTTSITNLLKKNNISKIDYLFDSIMRCISDNIDNLRDFTNFLNCLEFDLINCKK